MTRTTPLWIGLALALGCGAEVPADGGMQRIELGNQAHKPKAENPAAIQDNSFRPAEQKGDPAAIQDNSFRPGDPAAIQDNTRPVEHKAIDPVGAKPQSGASMVSKRETKAIEPAPAKDATAVKASVVRDQAKPGPATDVKIPPMK